MPVIHLAVSLPLFSLSTITQPSNFFSAAKRFVCSWALTATMKRTRLCTRATEARVARKIFTCGEGLLISISARAVATFVLGHKWIIHRGESFCCLAEFPFLLSSGISLILNHSSSAVRRASPLTMNRSCTNGSRDRTCSYNMDNSAPKHDWLREKLRALKCRGAKARHTHHHVTKSAQRPYSLLKQVVFVLLTSLAHMLAF